MNNPAETLRPYRHAWLIVGLLVPVALLNYLDRQMLAAMKASVGSPGTELEFAL